MVHEYSCGWCSNLPNETIANETVALPVEISVVLIFVFYGFVSGRGWGSGGYGSQDGGGAKKIVNLVF